MMLQPKMIWKNLKKGLALAALTVGCMWLGIATVWGRDTCDRIIPQIMKGYGSNGPYTMDEQSVSNPEFRRSVKVFFPKGAKGKRPVVFFSHGYGPNRWQSYKDLLRHIVSRGYIVVYSTYPMLFANNDERYNDLWAGFQAAAARFSKRMDLDHVGFVGHSFGGGATPAMAYHGFVERTWGKKGAFMMEMAPWYEYQINVSKWRQLPDHVAQLVEVYDNDQINDHRMAIDVFNSSPMIQKYYLMVRSTKMKNCDIVADHSTPGRSNFQRQKQYAVFRPFDALASCVFSGTSNACDALVAMGKENSQLAYQPLFAEKIPKPAHPQSYYKFPWSDSDNPLSVKY